MQCVIYSYPFRPDFLLTCFAATLIEEVIWLVDVNFHLSQLLEEITLQNALCNSYSMFHWVNIGPHWWAVCIYTLSIK